jgi:hypothetical protein
LIFERALFSSSARFRSPAGGQTVLLLPPESQAAEYTAWFPKKPWKKRTLSVRVSVSPLPVADEPAPLIWRVYLRVADVSRTRSQLEYRRKMRRDLESGLPDSGYKAADSPWFERHSLTGKRASRGSTLGGNTKIMADIRAGGCGIRKPLQE